MMVAAPLALACAREGDSGPQDAYAGGGAPVEIPQAPAVMERAGGENFPVALRLLPARRRRALLAVYGFARLADEIGDELAGDRLAALDWLQRELELAYAGRATHPLLVRLQQALVEQPLPREPLLGLIEANRVDQRVAHYETWEQLQGYCELSANPVGELVLVVFEQSTPERVALSDRVCTGLQLTEHLQDMAEDVRRGRFYLPERDLERFRCSHEELAGLVSGGGAGAVDAGVTDTGAAEGLRRAVSFEAQRARELLWAGAPLAASLRGTARIAVAAFAGGGLAALERIERAGFDVLGKAVPAAGKAARARWTARVLLACARQGARGPLAPAFDPPRVR